MVGGCLLRMRSRSSPCCLTHSWQFQTFQPLEISVQSQSILQLPKHRIFFYEEIKLLAVGVDDFFFFAGRELACYLDIVVPQLLAKESGEFAFDVVEHRLMYGAE